jgi:ADP-ribose pyrophosphatase
MSEQAVSTETIYTGKILTVRKDQMKFPNGHSGTREVVACADAVAVVALTDLYEVLMVKQYRHPAGQELWEIPAGKIEAGESPLQSAQRELEEETGYRAHNWRQVYFFYTSPGFCTEKIYLLLASDLTKYKQNLDPDEFIEVEKISLHKAMQMAASGQILDAKTIIGLLTADRYLKQSAAQE